MIFGICSGPELANAAAEAGFDYLDATVEWAVCPKEPDPVFQARSLEIFSLPIAIRNLTCLLPGDYALCGPEAMTEKAIHYTSTALRRAATLGIRTVAFGSGWSRKSPDGWPLEKAFEQITAFVRGVAPVAELVGVTLVVENLRAAETNMLNTVDECARLVRAVDSPAVRILVDGYHWATEQDSPESIIRNSGLIRNLHLATTAQRKAPGDEPCDFTPFADAVRASGYNDTLSIECSIADKSPAGLRKIYTILNDTFNR